MATQDGNGVFLLYTNDGNIRTDYNDRGSRKDLSNPPINCEFTMYISTSGSDDVAAKGRGGRHSDSASCDGCCYIPACPTGGGSPRCRTECPHPDYGGCGGVTNENNCASSSSTKGFKWIVWNTTNNCVHWEFWQDQGNSSSSPANQWVRLSHSTDCNGYGELNNCGGGPLLRPRGSSSQFTWRIDTSNDSKWESAVALVAGNSAPPPPGSTTPDPGTGGSGPGSPGTGGSGPGSIPGGGGMPGGNTGEPSPTPNNPNPGNGGGGAGNDFNTGTAQAFAQGGCAISSTGSATAQAGDCSRLGGTGDPGANPGDGAGAGGATEPKPIVTVYKDLTVLYNIRVDLADNCTISGNPNITNFESIYNVSPTAGVYRTLFQSSTTAFVGTKLHSSQSTLHNKKIRKVTVTMKKSTGVALTGLLRMEIRDRNGNIMYDDFNTIDPATLTLNDQTYDFISTDTDYRLQAGDSILISYVDGGDTTNHVLLAAAESGVDQFDGFNSVYVESASGLSYDVDQLQDFAAQIFI